MHVVRWAIALSMSWGVLIGGFTGGDREQTVAMYLDQFTHRG